MTVQYHRDTRLFFVNTLLVSPSKISLRASHHLLSASPGNPMLEGYLKLRTGDRKGTDVKVEICLPVSSQASQVRHTYGEGHLFNGH